MGTSSNPVNPCLKVCLSGCAGVSLQGLTISLYAPDGTLVASCTTDATGCCNPGITGLYTVVVSKGGVTYYSSAGTGIGVTAGRVLIPVVGTTTISLTGTGGDVVCCGGYMIPKNLTLTDALGPLPLTYTPSLGTTIWIAMRNVNVGAAFPWTCGSNSASGPIFTSIGPPVPGATGICYTMNCRAGSTPQFTMDRGWVDGFYPLDGKVYYRLNPSGVIGCMGDPCETGPSGSTGSANPSSASPFAISFSMALFPGVQPLPDPVGGNVAVSA